MISPRLTYLRTESLYLSTRFLRFLSPTPMSVSLSTCLLLSHALGVSPCLCPVLSSFLTTPLINLACTKFTRLSLTHGRAVWICFSHKLSSFNNLDDFCFHPPSFVIIVVYFSWPHRSSVSPRLCCQRFQISSKPPVAEEILSLHAPFLPMLEERTDAKGVWENLLCPNPLTCRHSALFKVSG